MKRLKIISKYSYLILFITIIYSLLFNNINIHKNNYINNYIKGYVIEINNDSIVVKGKEKVLVKLNKKININYHDYVYIEGKLTEPSNNTIFNLFNYKKYLSNKKIYYVLKMNDFEIIRKNKNIFYKIKNNINKYINKFKSKDYLNIFIIGNKSYLDNDIKNIYKDLGIIHLLSISGTYISIIIYILNKFIKNKYTIFIILFFYLFITNFQISILRSELCYLLFLLNKKYKANIDKKDILILLASLLLLIKPYYLYDIGFLLSFIITYSLIRFSYLLKDKSYLKKSFLISIISFLSSFPIIINTYFSINFLSIIYNIFYVPFTCFIIYPLSLLTFIFPFLDNLLFILIRVFENISIFLNNINILTFSFSKIPIFLIIIYYIFLFNKNKKIVILIFLFYLYNYYLFMPRIYFIDVGQGDSALIRIKNKSILIDTGGSYTYDNSKNLVMFFKSVGVKKIDYVIITHGDYDHMGEAINLVNNFKIEKVIFNCGEFNDLEKELIKVLDKKKIKYYSCIKELNIDKNKLYFLQTKVYDNENDNSNVIYTELNGHKFMFMGDASVTTEKEILDKYNLPNIDVLKVGHHGSKTSSSKEFINEINPKYSIISVGKNNRYGHPNKEVLDNLENSKICRIDQDGSIMFKIKNNKLKIKTCSP